VAQIRVVGGLVCGLTLLASVGPPAAGLAKLTGVDAALDVVIEPLMAQGHIPGLTAAVISGGAVRWTKAYGFADLEAGRRTAIDDAFAIGSITKQFTATGILLLQQAGKLRLEDALTSFLPRLPARYLAVTLHHLLSHTSCVAANLRDQAHHMDSLTGEALVAELGRRELAFEPGSRVEYSGTARSSCAWT